jgi:hypothetical protein
VRVAADACLFLLELMTAREYRTRFEPGTLEFMADLDAVLKEETERAALVAIERGLEPSEAGTYPLAIWRVVAAHR